jgi:hypothetical protein
VAWWNSSLDRLKARFAPGSAPAAAHVGRPAASPPEEWRDVPRLQRTLAEPILPVAINDGFRDSLATFANPSFLAPLSHHVDPTSGGLAAGLVAPGRPQTHDGPELAVPRRAQRPTTPRVQRRTTGGAEFADLSTVPLEFPDQTESTTSPTSATMSPTAVQRQPLGAAPVAGRRPEPLPSTTAGRPGETSPEPSDGTHAFISEGTRPVGPETTTLVSRLEQATGGTDQVGPITGPDKLDQPTVGLPGTGLDKLDQPPVGLPITGLEKLDQPRAQSLRPTVAAFALQRAAAGLRPDVPTLAARTLTTSLSRSDEPISPRIALPSEPPVQHLMYTPGDLHPDCPHASAAPRGVGGNDSAPRASAPDLPIQTLRELPSLERPMSPEGASLPTILATAPVQRQVVGPSAAQTARIASAAPGTEEEWGSEGTDSRHVDPKQPATEPLAQGFTEVPLVVARSTASQGATLELPRPDGAVDVSSPSWPQGPSHSEGAQRTGPSDGHLGETVPVEPWTPPEARTMQALGGTTRVAAPIAAVQRRVAATSPAERTAEPTEPFRRAGGSFSPMTEQQPLVVARQLASPRVPEGRPRPGEGMSFASMFADAGLSRADSDAALTGVQRQPADGGAAAAEPSVSMDTASEPTAAPAPAAGPATTAGSAANLDEMARRLYEPLAARLREELWLDRERAGLMSDA